MIAYHPVYPGDEGSPLEKDIDETDRLELAYGQNTFSLDVASINYDYPSNILFSWKIDGYHKEWSRPSQDNRIIIRNLPPGSYTLQIRAVSNEEKYKTYETRSIQIIITPPVWASVWAMVGYVILLVLVMGIWVLYSVSSCCINRRRCRTKKHGSSLIRHTTYVHR